MFGKRDVDQRFAHFCRTGDPGALGDVFDGTAARLLRVAMWLVGNRADADDVLQRTFVQAIEQRERFEPGRPVLPWLIGLLGHQAAKVRRERARRLPVGSGGDVVCDPEVEASARELQAAVQNVGDRLGAPYCEVLVLHLEQGLNAKEIAQRLERPAGTVRTQLMRALELLRQRLPVGFAGGLAVVGPMELAPLRSALLSAAGSAAPAAVAAGALVGGVVVAKKLLVMVPLVVLLGAAVWLAEPWRDAGTPPLVLTAKQEQAVAGGPNIDTRVPAMDERSPVATVQTEVKPSGALRIAVRVVTESGLPVPNAQVIAYEAGRERGTSQTRRDGCSELNVRAGNEPRDWTVHAWVPGATAIAPVVQGTATIVLSNLGWIELQFLGEGRSSGSLFSPGARGPACSVGPDRRRFAVGLGLRFHIQAGMVDLHDVQGPLQMGQVVRVDIDDRMCTVRGRLCSPVPAGQLRAIWIQDARCIEPVVELDPAAGGAFEFAVLRRSAPCTIGIVGGGLGREFAGVEANAERLDLGDIELEPLSLLGTVRATAGGQPLERAPWIRAARLRDGTPLTMFFGRGAFVVTDTGAASWRVESLPCIAGVTMTVSNPGFAARHAPLSGGQDLTLQLERAGHVEVHAHAPLTREVPDLMLERETDADRPERSLGMPHPDGGFRLSFRDVAPGRYRLVSKRGEVVGGDDIIVMAGVEQRINVTFRWRQDR